MPSTPTRSGRHNREPNVSPTASTPGQKVVPVEDIIRGEANGVIEQEEIEGEGLPALVDIIFTVELRRDANGALALFGCIRAWSVVAAGAA